MKKIQILILLASIFLTIMIVDVQEVQTEVYLLGKKEVETGEDNTLNVKVSNENAIGVVQGVISYDINIQDVTIISSYNGWTATFNEETGIFNAFNAEGTKDGEILQIHYKLKDGANKGTITISNIELTTIDYNTINLENKISYSINKKTEQQDNKEEKDNKDKETVNENETFQENQNNRTNDEKNNIIENTVVIKSKNTTETSKTAQQKLPHTGKTMIKIIFAIMILGIIAILFYNKNSNLNI